MSLNRLITPRRTPALITDRTVAYDATRGVYILKAQRKPRRPCLNHIEGYRRMSLLQDYLDTHGYPMPPVRIIRETLLQRLARLRRRASGRKAWAAGPAQLEGALS